jgi:hypothetical protein
MSDWLVAETSTWQTTTMKTDKYPCPQRDSNPQSQHASGRTPTPWSARLLGPAIKATRCTNFTNLFLELNSTCFGQFVCPSSGVFHCTHSKPVWRIPLLCVQWKTPDDRQRNCPKYVEFHSKNKFEKLVNLVGFIIRNSTSITKDNTWILFCEIMALHYDKQGIYS